MQGMPGWMKWTISLLIGLGIILVGFKFAGWLLTAFFVMNCLVLIIVVLLQSGKAADLAGAFGGAGSQTAFGPRGAASLLSQATTWCAVMFMICAMALVLRVDRAGGVGGGSVLEKVSKPAPAKTAPVTTVPVTPRPSRTQLRPPRRRRLRLLKRPRNPARRQRNRQPRLRPHSPKSSSQAFVASLMPAGWVSLRAASPGPCALRRPTAKARAFATASSFSCAPQLQPLRAPQRPPRLNVIFFPLRPKNKIAGKPLRRESYLIINFPKIWCGREDSNLHALRR